MWYMPMHIAVHASYMVACTVFLYMKIFICFIKQACLQSFPKLGGVDNSILWLSFAQRKPKLELVQRKTVVTSAACIMSDLTSLLLTL
jgi:hypothetical protein